MAGEQHFDLIVIGSGSAASAAWSAARGLGKSAAVFERDTLGGEIIADGNGRIVGAAIVAPRAGEMIHELVIAISLGATAQQVGEAIHAFPTFSEAVMSACSEVGGS